jgi:hypothetical protein
MKVITVSTILIFIALVFTCSNSKNVAKAGQKDFEVYFGNSGGFTNINPMYKVNHFGEVYKRENTSSGFVLLKKIKKRQVKDIFVLITKSNFSKLNINKLSNMNRFIEVKTSSGQNKITWYEDSQVPSEILQLERILNDLVKN